MVQCKSLQAINVDEENKVYSSINGLLFNKNKTKLLKCSDAKQNIEIPATVTEIKEDFWYNDVLKTINVSENNENFSSRGDVLYNKSREKLIKCPAGKKGDYFIDNNTKQIESNAFRHCQKLENIVLSNELEEIGYSAFAGCKKLKKIVIPETVKSIKSNAFANCEELKGVILEGNLKEADYDMFWRSNPHILILNLQLKPQWRTLEADFMKNPRVLTRSE